MLVLLIALLISAVGMLSYRFWRNGQKENQLYQQVAIHAHKTLSDKTLKKALAEADACGLGADFRDYLHGISKHTGQHRIKVGHLLWIFAQLEAGERFNNNMSIPDY